MDSLVVLGVGFCVFWTAFLYFVASPDALIKYSSMPIGESLFWAFVETFCLAGIIKFPAPVLWLILGIIIPFVIPKFY